LSTAFSKEAADRSYLEEQWMWVNSGRAIQATFLRPRMRYTISSGWENATLIRIRSRALVLMSLSWAMALIRIMEIGLISAIPLWSQLALATLAVMPVLRNGLDPLDWHTDLLEVM